jgi:hypothetical protein
VGGSELEADDDEDGNDDDERDEEDDSDEEDWVAADAPALTRDPADPKSSCDSGACRTK